MNFLNFLNFTNFTNRVGRDNNPSVWFSQHVFNSVQQLAKEAKSTEEIIQILNVIKDIPLSIPLSFIQKKIPVSHTNDPQLRQVINDLRREIIILGGKTFQATMADSDTDGFSSKIMFLLMESIRRLDPKLSTIDLLRITRKSLLHTYRSQTGGDCYYAVNALLGNSNLIHLMQKSVPASDNPITFSVKETLPTVHAV